jgi:hypothetical protein
MVQSHTSGPSLDCPIGALIAGPEIADVLAGRHE